MSHIGIEKDENIKKIRARRKESVVPASSCSLPLNDYYFRRKRDEEIKAQHGPVRVIVRDGKPVGS